jgi:DNA polymerase I-like protein with 3'-5' exonuclease and polymerase domains
LIVFDLETDGLLPEVSKVHTLTLYDTETNTYTTFDKERVPIGINKVMEAKAICGHNVIGYDLPVIQKIYGMIPIGIVRDTLVLSRLAYPEIKELDFALLKQGKFPGNLIGRYSLEAWGHRLGEYKGIKMTDFSEWTQEMSDYCAQDVKVTATLLNRCKGKGIPEGAIELEHQVATIVQRQVEHGFCFDKNQAEKFYSELLKKQKALGAKLAEFFPPWTTETIFVPKRNNKTLGYIKDQPFTKVKIIEFNPGSRAHIANRLTTLYGWKPTEWTDDGSPALDEEVLKTLQYPEAPYLAEYFLISKRIGQLAEGKEAWLTNVQKDGRIHGSVNTIGAVTRRMTHAHPNVAQVPRVGTPYGLECRSLFHAPEGHVLVGIDASGLELRCLAHYMAAYDNGAYVQELLKGDIHTSNQRLAGLPDRNSAKTFIYAFLYGAGDLKIGSILGKGSAAGKKVKTQFLDSLPALASLKSVVETVAKEKGVLRSLDGAAIKVRSQHAALNTLLQGAGAIIMKKALVVTDHLLQTSGLIPGDDYEFVANIHDEWQIECKDVLGRIVGDCGVKGLVRAGELFNLRCPLDGMFKIGKTWADTH